MRYGWFDEHPPTGAESEQGQAYPTTARYRRLPMSRETYQGARQGLRERGADGDGRSGDGDRLGELRELGAEGLEGPPLGADLVEGAVPPVRSRGA